MHSVLPAPFTVLFEFNFTLNKLPILSAPVISALTIFARKFYKLIL